MKLMMKLLSVFLVATVLVTIADGYLAVRAETEKFEQQTKLESERLAVAVEPTLADIWKQSGAQKAIDMVRRLGADRYQVAVRWVWFDVSPDNPNSPDAPQERFRNVQVHQTISVRARDSSGQWQLHTYWPLEMDNRRGGLEFTRSMTELDAARRKTTLHTILLVLAIACVSTAAIAISGIVMVGRPLKKLVNKTRRMGDGDLTGPVRLNSSDELAELGQSLNAMCERLSESQRRADQEAAARLAAMEQLRHADRLKTVGRLASGIAHELGTPLNVVSGRASLIGSGKLNAEEVSASVEVIKGETDRMAALIQRLLDFSRRRESQRVTADVVPIVRQTIELLDSMAQNHKVQLNMTGEQPSPARADVSQLQQVFTNLIVNAIQAMPQGGTVHVSVAQTNADPPAQIDTDYEQFVRISVRDEGAGIAAEDIEHIFEPFFTTKDVGEGTGLGLSIVHRIVDEHGGWIDVRSNPNEGSCFDVFLPSA